MDEDKWIRQACYPCTSIVQYSWEMKGDKKHGLHKCYFKDYPDTVAQVCKFHEGVIVNREQRTITNRKTGRWETFRRGKLATEQSYSLDTLLVTIVWDRYENTKRISSEYYPTLGIYNNFPRIIY